MLPRFLATIFSKNVLAFFSGYLGYVVFLPLLAGSVIDSRHKNVGNIDYASAVHRPFK
jgi:hypothetical protein